MFHFYYAISPRKTCKFLRPFEIHCGDYKRMMHGYRQRTGPFRVTWCPVLVEDKIDSIEDHCRKWKLQNVFTFLIRKGDCSYFKFVKMQRNRAKKPFLYEIFSSPEYEGIECALWPTLYHKTNLCESLIHGKVTMPVARSHTCTRSCHP